jgi:hypothetical protein
MIIRRIEINKVIVPARPDSINSPETDHALHKLPSKGKKGWSLQFDQLSKHILQIKLENGVIGLDDELLQDIPSLIRRYRLDLVFQKPFSGRRQ